MCEVLVAAGRARRPCGVPACHGCVGAVQCSTLAAVWALRWLRQGACVRPACTYLVAGHAHPPRAPGSAPGIVARPQQARCAAAPSPLGTARLTDWLADQTGSQLASPSCGGCCCFMPLNTLCTSTCCGTLALARSGCDAHPPHVTRGGPGGQAGSRGAVRWLWWPPLGCRPPGRHLLCAALRWYRVHVFAVAGGPGCCELCATQRGTARNVALPPPCPAILPLWRGGTGMTVRQSPWLSSPSRPPAAARLGGWRGCITGVWCCAGMQGVGAKGLGGAPHQGRGALRVAAVGMSKQSQSYSGVVWGTVRVHTTSLLAMV